MEHRRHRPATAPPAQHAEAPDGAAAPDRRDPAAAGRLSVRSATGCAFEPAAARGPRSEPVECRSAVMWQFLPTHKSCSDSRNSAFSGASPWCRASPRNSLSVQTLRSSHGSPANSGTFLATPAPPCARRGSRSRSRSRTRARHFLFNSLTDAQIVVSDDVVQLIGRVDRDEAAHLDPAAREAVSRTGRARVHRREPGRRGPRARGVLHATCARTPATCASRCSPRCSATSPVTTASRATTRRTPRRPPGCRSNRLPRSATGWSSASTRWDRPASP